MAKEVVPVHVDSLRSKDFKSGIMQKGDKNEKA